MIMDKKKVLIFSGIGVAVLGLSLGLGLGLGLGTGEGDGADNCYRSPTGNACISPGQPVTENGQTFKTRLGEDGKVYGTIESFKLEFGSPTVNLPAFGSHLGTISTSEQPILKNGANNPAYDAHAFNVEYGGIGVVKIPNDGKIWRIQNGAATESVEINDKGVAYVPLDWGKAPGTTAVTDDSKVVPFKLFHLGGEVRTATGGGANESPNAPTLDKIGAWMDTNTAGTTFKYNADGTIKTEDADNDDATPETNVQGWPGGWGDDDNKPSATGTTDISATNFKIRELKTKNAAGEFVDATFNAPTGTTGANAHGVTVNVPAKDLYYPVKITAGGEGRLPLQGSVTVSPQGTITIDGKTFNVGEKTNFATVTDVDIEIKRTVGINEAVYGKAGSTRSQNELFISVEDAWFDYFQETANLSSVKDLAKSLGVTIRFKKGPADDERNYISTVGVQDQRASELFFTPADAVGNFNVGNRLQPLKYDLKTELEKESAFAQSWRETAKIQASARFPKTVGQLALYPFNQEVQMIAYNTDVVGENGFDFTTKTLGDYLANSNYGDLQAVQGAYTPIADTATDAEKAAAKNKRERIFTSNHLVISGAIWAFDFYKSLQTGQVAKQQDMVWRVNPKATAGSNEAKSFYTVFADTARLAASKEFQAWVDQYKQGNAVTLGDSADSLYAKSALFNGHLGGTVVGPWWITNDWQSGKFRATGTATEKAEFARKKIKFQALPTSNNPLANGWYGGMTAGISDKKQQLAEKFLFELTNPSRAVDFSSSLSKFSARQDVNLSSSDNPIIASASAAIANSDYVSRVGIGSDTNWIWGVFSAAAAAITSTSTYQSVAEDLLDRTQKDTNTYDQGIYVPGSTTPTAVKP